MVMSLYAWRDGQTGVHHPALDSKSSAFAGVPCFIEKRFGSGQRAVVPGACRNRQTRRSQKPLALRREGSSPSAPTILYRLYMRSPPRLTWSSALYI